MAATTLTITGTFEDPDTTTPVGSVTFVPNTTGPHWVNGGVVVPNAPKVIPLAAGALPGGFAVVRCPGGYMVTENVPSLGLYGTYLIPDQAGPVDLSSFH